MKDQFDSIYNRLHKIYAKHLRRYKNPDSKQICCMWSTRNPPDEVCYSKQMDDICSEFDIDISEDEAIETYNMVLSESTDFIISKMIAKK